MQIFVAFGLTQPGIEPESTASVADALSTQSLIGYQKFVKFYLSFMFTYLKNFAGLT